MSDDEHIQYGIRLPKSALDRVDKIAERMSKSQEGVRFTRADVLRRAMFHGLDILEAEKPKKK